MNILKTIRNNWKKCTFAAAAVTYGGYTAKTHIDITKHMISVCDDVREYADKDVNNKPKSVLVIMNPVANKKKAEKLFRDYCEPILHLAGYSVEIVKTNSVGHAKTYIETLNTLPDAVVVAGGDGTSSEVVTGLLRRNDTPCPIVLLPLGLRSETAFKYLNIEPTNKLEQVKACTATLLPMILERIRLENVIKFDVIPNESNIDEKDINLKPIYGLNNFSWGVLRDIESLKEKYWYFGALRHYAAALFNSYSDHLTWKLRTDFVYSPPCPGCRNCHIKRATKQTKSYFQKLLVNREPIDQDKLIENIQNINCDKLYSGKIETSQLNIKCNRNHDSFYELETRCSNPLVPGFDFIKNISIIEHEDEVKPLLVLKSRTIKLMPNLEGTTDAKTSYSIDGEEYDARPVKISIIPNAIKIYV